MLKILKTDLPSPELSFHMFKIFIWRPQPKIWTLEEIIVFCLSEYAENGSSRLQKGLDYEKNTKNTFFTTFLNLKKSRFTSYNLLSNLWKTPYCKVLVLITQNNVWLNTIRKIDSKFPRLFSNFIVSNPILINP